MLSLFWPCAQEPIATSAPPPRNDAEQKRPEFDEEVTNCIAKNRLAWEHEYYSLDGKEDRPRINDVISKALMHPLKRSFMERFAGLGAYLEAWLSLNHKNNVGPYHAVLKAPALASARPDHQTLQKIF